MPLMPEQIDIAKLLANQRSPDSHLAGGAALHLEPNTRRYSKDLDYFHDSVERVASAFAADSNLLKAHGYQVLVEMQQPGYIRCLVKKGKTSTKIEWAHDSSWRFLPVIKNDCCGYQLHPIDLALNKVLTLAGRDEPRDFLDTLDVHRNILPLGALCWAAVGKDPGFSPLSLLSLLRRKGRYQPEDFGRLHLVKPVALQELKTEWLAALDSAEQFIRKRPPTEVGCLYYSKTKKQFVAPAGDEPDVVPHYGRPGGVLPAMDFE
jgi:hypothetical protein